MPIQYEGIVAEHLAVRESVGVFDISHMGQFLLRGGGGGSWLNTLLTNDTDTLADGGGQYTLMLNESGGVIDDMIIYRESAEQFFLVVNASKIEEDYHWMAERLGEGLSLENQSDSMGGVAVQGPDASSVWEKLETGTALPERNGIVRGDGWIACRTGYTGEDGFEFFAPGDAIGDWFRTILDAGAVPCGLGARDTLRLEKCYPLNGNDLDPVHTPLEAGLGFFVKLGKEEDFPGKAVLVRQKAEGLVRKLVALEVIGKAPPPRHCYAVFDPESGEQLGELASGGLSPSLKKGIALAYLPSGSAKPGTRLELDVRGRRFPLEVVKKPFV